jgi:hypothetical protein
VYRSTLIYESPSSAVLHGSVPGSLLQAYPVLPDPTPVVSNPLLRHLAADHVGPGRSLEKAAVTPAKPALSSERRFSLQSGS